MFVLNYPCYTIDFLIAEATFALATTRADFPWKFVVSPFSGRRQPGWSSAQLHFGLQNQLVDL